LVHGFWSPEPRGHVRSGTDLAGPQIVIGGVHPTPESRGVWPMDGRGRGQGGLGPHRAPTSTDG